MIPIPSTLDAFPLRYFGHKGKILKHILPLIPEGTQTLLEPFGGTGIVSWSAKQAGIQVVVNDILLCAHLRHRMLIANDGVLFDQDDMRLLAGASSQTGNFHERYLSIVGETNAVFLDGLVGAIPLLSNQMKRDMATVIPCLVAMKNLQFASYCFSPLGTLTGCQHLHNTNLKQAFITFATSQLPQLVSSNGRLNEAHQSDAVALIGKTKADCLYLDPPYAGTRAARYEATHAIWEDWCRYLLGRGEEVKNSYDLTADLPSYTLFERRRPAIVGLMEIFERAQHIPTIILSYNTTCAISQPELEGIARTYGRHVVSHNIPYRLPVTIKGKSSYTEEILLVATAKQPRKEYPSSFLGEAHYRKSET